MQVERVQAAIDAIKNGEMIIIMDDESRENEGDIVFAGEFSTTQKVNFLLKEARGVLCVSLTSDLAAHLDLPLMVDKNSSNHETAFTISIDAKSAKTGVSAFERDMTIRLICDEGAKPSDFARPGHIFPLIAKEGGVLERTGHTEASVDICKLAGLKPVAVICELLKSDGSAASNNDDFVAEFALKHDLKVLYVADLVHYRFQYEQLVSHTSRESVRFCGHPCVRHNFIDHLSHIHIVYQFFCNAESQDSPNLTAAVNLEGENPANPAQNPAAPKSAANVRFHAIGSALNLLENEHFEVLQKSIDFLAKNGGFLICLNGEKPAAHDESKDFGIGAQILKYFKIEEFLLLTTHQNRNYVALQGFGLKIKEKILM